MNSKWQINRIGLVDFWYYDEEEFYFLDGRMLLRGSNGSGKSVTMQSFIPLLLDGNMRPERLDPFGSRARKMENYLLEENDTRDERTGYLYMEFKRIDADSYMTIGMGMRARKNKKLDPWYFCLQDGRRANKDFPLYKEGKAKITLSKQELKNRIGDGGKVFDTQTEYMEMVNRQIFGFDTMEEYKEMIELLIQLRTPKLSKDFKPSVLNEILGNSLAPLSEDDLRTMSEAIENMDNLKTNLDALKESFQAAKKIEREYAKYNQAVLLMKADSLLSEKKKLDEMYKEEKEKTAHLMQNRENYQAASDKVESLKREEQIVREEQDSLNDSDATRLAQQQQFLIRELEENQKQCENKENSYSAKKEQRVAIEGKRKEQEEKSEGFFGQMEEYLEDMGEQISSLTFDEHTFMEKDILEQPEKAYGYDLHRKLLAELEEKVEEGRRKLAEEEEKRRSYDGILKKLEEAKTVRSLQESQCRQAENQLIEIKSELVENIHLWNQKNQQLKLSAEALQRMEGFIQAFTMESDYDVVRKEVRDVFDEVEKKLKDELYLIGTRLKELQGEIKKTKQELKEWQDKTDPEPECEEAVRENRKRLQEAGIPYVPFYKTVDFQADLSEERANYLEEALLRMGILDALIVPSQYKDKVLTMEAGTCDKYLFDDAEPVKANMNMLLDVDNRENDILFYQQVSNVLSGIASGGKFHTSVKEDGIYQIGMVIGTITREYKAKYIGAKAREAFRQEKIAYLEEKLAEQGQAEAKILEDEKAAAEWFHNLSSERKQFPEDKDLRAAMQASDEAERKMQRCQQDVKDYEEKESQIAKQLSEVRNQAQTIAAKVYLPARLDVFFEAAQSLRDYERLLGKLEMAHNNYLNSRLYQKDLVERVEKTDEDIDEILYDLNKLKSAGKQLQERLDSVSKQLDLTNYEQIKERLSYCVKRLEEIPSEKETYIRKSENLRNAIDNGEQELLKCQQQITESSECVQVLEQIFTKEQHLRYVELSIPEEKTRSAADIAKICMKTLEKSFLGKTEELRDSLQKVYLENRSALLEYNLESVYIFVPDEGAKVSGRRIDILGKYRGTPVHFLELMEKMQEAILEQDNLLSEQDRELFEDILANTVSKKIRAKIYKSSDWVGKMNDLMGSMQTSSGLTLSLKWKAKRAEQEEQLDTRELVELLKKDTEIMRDEEFAKLSGHFRSKIAEARKLLEQTESVKSFHMIMKEVLDYRKWFEFTLECKKTGENKKELTDRVFFTFSGGEKAMSMYVPLFSAVVAKYEGARADAPRLISLDEAFAGVDEMNIKDMFRLMVEFQFDFILNSQILYGDYETVPSLAIYQLLRPENAKYVTVISYIWNGRKREYVQSIGDTIE